MRTTVFTVFGVLLVGAGLVGCGSNPAKAVTTIRQATDAVVVAADGTTQPAAKDQRLRPGESVRTGAAGSVSLDTDGRIAYLGASAAYTVRSGVAGVLQRGAFVVDARRGPSLQLNAGSVQVDTGRSAVRVERSFSLRVGALAGSATVTTGPSADVGMTLKELHQVVVAGRALPDKATPLVLTNDDAEGRVVPDLVADDAVLNNTAFRLDRGPEGRALVRLAGAEGLDVRVGAAALSRAPALSETALPVALASAAAGSDSAAFEASYDRAVELRTDGGSWAVVARLVGTNATAAGQALDALLDGVAGVGPTLATGTLGNNPTGTTERSPGPQQTRTPTTRPSQDGDGDGPNNPGEEPTEEPNPNPSPTPDDGLLDEPVEDIVDIVEDILPPLGGPERRSKDNSCKVLGLLNC